MEKDIRTKMYDLWNLLDDIGWDISQAKERLDNIEMDLKEKEENIIKYIENLKRELKRDGLYSDKLEEFLENYMKYYNK